MRRFLSSPLAFILFDLSHFPDSSTFPILTNLHVSAARTEYLAWIVEEGRRAIARGWASRPPNHLPWLPRLLEIPRWAAPGSKRRTKKRKKSISERAAVADLLPDTSKAVFDGS